MRWFPSTNFSEFFLAPYMFITGWFFSGVGVIGQPHVMVRFMTIDNTKNIPKQEYIITLGIHYFIH